MSGETLTVTEFEKDIQNLFVHFRRVSKKYSLNQQQISVMFAAIEVKQIAGVLSEKLENED
jgi:hypothetical protein